VPMFVIFSEGPWFGPWIGVPIVNYAIHQHSSAFLKVGILKMRLGHFGGGDGKYMGRGLFFGGFEI